MIKPEHLIQMGERAGQFAPYVQAQCQNNRCWQ